VNVHVAVPAVVPAARLHEVNVPEAVPDTVIAIVPVGVVAPLVDVSTTVTVHVDAWLMTTVEGLQLIDVVVGWTPPNVKVPVLEA
jgi:hypothetical protein